jgi:hypothetical protein
MDPANPVSPFDQGFDGFPRRLPENCVEYYLFILDGQLEARKLLSALENVRKAATQLCARLTKDYVWQRDGLQLEVKNENGLVYLRGTSCYGDAVEDEWLIVYLLRELTKSFENLWVRVFDSDGEFLLVEAANVLPSWLSPEIDSNRVWIHQGKLFIIPLEKGLHDKRPLTLGDASAYLRTKPTSLVHSTFIEAEAFYRLEKYPGQIEDSLHHSLITIPRKLAYILHEKPAAIAPAVEAFYLRDPVSMKSLLSTSGTLNFPPQDLVTVSTKFSKVLFAQLKSQRFTEPPVWIPVVNAAEKSGTGAESSQKQLDRLHMGMKVTSGFEMLATNADTNDNRIAREIGILLDDLKEDGDQVLPDDAAIRSWEGSTREDPEHWMDINYEDFERELDGKAGSKGTGRGGGFGDSAAQADLQKIVSRFESFLNDESAGFEGAELNDMDFDDDDLSDDYEEEDSEDEDKEVSFDEDQFSKMMREMMGMPSQETPRAKSSGIIKASSKGPATGEQSDDDEHEAIRQLAAQMESELNDHGALQLDPTPRKLKAPRQKGEEQSKDKGNDVDDEESGDEEVDIDYNLAKNLLESFKSQAGMAGPAGNLLGMMGMQLPRDEDENEKE